MSRITSNSLNLESKISLFSSLENHLSNERFTDLKHMISLLESKSTEYAYSSAGIADRIKNYQKKLDDLSVSHGRDSNWNRSSSDAFFMLFTSVECVIEDLENQRRQWHHKEQLTIWMVKLIHSYLVYVTGSSPQPLRDVIDNTFEELPALTCCRFVAACVLAAATQRIILDVFLRQAANSLTLNYIMRNFSVNNDVNFSALNLLGYCFLAGGLADKGTLIPEFRRKMEGDCIWAANLSKTEFSDEQQRVLGERATEYTYESAREHGCAVLIAIRDRQAAARAYRSEYEPNITNNSLNVETTPMRANPLFVERREHEPSLFTPHRERADLGEETSAQRNKSTTLMSQSEDDGEDEEGDHVGVKLIIVQLLLAVFWLFWTMLNFICCLFCLQAFLVHV